MKNIGLIVLIVLFTTASFASDILTLTNSQVFEGKVTKIKDCSVIFKTATNKYEIPVSEVYSIEFKSKNDKVFTRYMDKLDVDPSKCVNGRLDAWRYHGKRSSHIALGFLFGPFALLGTAMSDPTPEKGQMTFKMSEHTDLLNDPDYINCYKKKAKGRLIGAEAIGLGILALMLLWITPNYLAGK